MLNYKHIIYISLGCILLLGACKPKADESQDWSGTQERQELRSLINEVVSDPDKAKGMIVLLDQAEKKGNAFLKKMTAINDEYTKLIAAYGTTEAEFKNITKKYDEVIEKYRNEIFIMGDLFRDLATEDEWNALAKKEKKILSQFLTSIRAWAI